MSGYFLKQFHNLNIIILLSLEQKHKLKSMS